MKVYRIEILNKKELQNLIDISNALKFFDIVLVLANTDLFTIKDLEIFLKDDEIKKLDVYKSEVSKMNFAVSRNILNKGFEKILRVPFEDVIVLRDKHHKPYIKNNIGIKFNISHTDGYVVLGFSKKDLGVDVEKVNDTFVFEDILENCFTFREIKSIGLDAHMFYKYWTAKEAYLKYEGCGLIRSPKEIEIIHMDNHRIKIKDNVKRINKDLIALNLSSGKYWGAICI